MLFPAAWGCRIMYTRRLAILPLIILLALVAFVPSPALAHQAAARAAVPDHFGRAQAQTEIGPDAVWRPTDSQMEELWTCFENPTCSPSLVMGVFDAPAAAIDFNQSRPCLLYTSPSPRDGLLSRMPSSA